MTEKTVNPEENARAYIEDALLPYLKPGIEELLNVAKAKGEVIMEGDELEVKTGAGRVSCCAKTVR